MMHVLKITFAFLILCLMVWGAAFASFLMHINTLSKTPLKTADAIVVLTGGPDRVNAGMDLLYNDVGSLLYISGVHPQTTRGDILKLWDGSPQNICCIYLDKQARDTYQNVRYSLDWADTKKVKKIIVVTSDFHLPRALSLFKAQTKDIDFIPFAVKGNKPLSYVAYEFTKYLYVRINIWFS